MFCIFIHHVSLYHVRKESLTLIAHIYICILGLVSNKESEMSADALTDRAMDIMFFKELLQGMAITFGK